MLSGDSACGVVSTRPWLKCKDPRAFATDILNFCKRQIQQIKQVTQAKQTEQSKEAEETLKTESDSRPPRPNIGLSQLESNVNLSQLHSNISLAQLVEQALKNTQEFGACSIGLLWLDDAGQKCGASLDTFSCSLFSMKWFATEVYPVCDYRRYSTLKTQVSLHPA